MNALRQTGSLRRFRPIEFQREPPRVPIQSTDPAEARQDTRKLTILLFETDQVPGCKKPVGKSLQKRVCVDFRPLCGERQNGRERETSTVWRGK